jgi:hypothetical protein
MQRARRVEACIVVLALAPLVVTLPGIAPPVRAQTGGGYDLSHNTIDGGGATFSSGGGYLLGGTIGQPDAGVLRGGGFLDVPRAGADSHFDANQYRAADTNGHADADPNVHGNPNVVSHPERNRHESSHTDAFPHHHCNRAASERHTDADRHSNLDRDSNTDGESGAHGHAHHQRGRYGHGDADSVRDPHSEYDSEPVPRRLRR